MTRWEYKWLRTFWVETERDGGYVTRISYGHRWRPDGATERPFPDEDGLNELGSEGWELVALSPSSETHQTVISPQGNDSWTSFAVQTLAFKRQQPG